MSAQPALPLATLTAAPAIVFRGGLVLTMDDAHTVHQVGDVLVVGTDIAAVGPDLDVPDGTAEVDASGG
ncbi:MAG: hypothetical protein ACKOVB_16845, partial [Terrabacter sp.]